MPKFDAIWLSRPSTKTLWSFFNGRMPSFSNKTIDLRWASSPNVIFLSVATCSFIFFSFTYGLSNNPKSNLLINILLTELLILSIDISPSFISLIICSGSSSPPYWSIPAIRDFLYLSLIERLSTPQCLPLIMPQSEQTTPSNPSSFLNKSDSMYSLYPIATSSSVIPTGIP